MEILYLCEGGLSRVLSWQVARAYLIVTEAEAGRGRDEALCLA